MSCRRICPEDMKDDAHFLCAHATVIEALLQTSELYHEVVTYAQNKRKADGATVYFLRKEQPSVNLALPPVGWHRTVVHP